MSRHVPILMYHNIVKTIHPEAPDWIDESLFRKQLNYLLEEGFTPISPDLLLTRHLLPPRPVLITFDDGYASTYEIAFPILKELNIKFTVFVIASFLSNDKNVKTNSWDIGNRPIVSHLSKKMIHEMLKSNLLTIGSHSFSHRLFHHLTEKEIEEEITQSLQFLKEEFNCDVRFFSYPGGHIGEKTTTYNVLKKANVKLAFSGEKEVVQYFKKTDYLDIERVNITYHHNFVNKKTRFRFEVVLISSLSKLSNYRKLNGFVKLLLPIHQFVLRVSTKKSIY